jgi:KTSC domain
MLLSRPLRSTAIAAASYETDTQTLEVEFVNGRTYTHEAVPLEVYEGLVGAPSPGSFYNSAIKGQY